MNFLALRLYFSLEYICIKKRYELISEYICIRKTIRSNIQICIYQKIIRTNIQIWLFQNKLETSKDALWKLQNFNTENWKPCTLDLSPYGMRNAEKIKVRLSLRKCSWSYDFVSKVISGFRQKWRKTFQIDLKCWTFQKDLKSDILNTFLNVVF